MVNRIQKWYATFKNYLFKYKDGFWELPCLLNSPDLLIASLSKMPFNKHHPKEQTIVTNNPFLKGVLHYQEIEEGLWLHVIELEFKANVSFKIVYDDEPTDYYSAGYYVQKTNYNSPIPTMNGIKFQNKSFTFNKPGVAIDASYYKGTSSVFISVYFNESWFKSNVLNNSSLCSDNLISFLNSNHGIIVWPDLIADTNSVYNSILNTIQQKGNKGAANEMQLKIQTLDLIATMYSKIAKLNLDNQQLSINEIDRKCLLKAEKILIENIFISFPGIDNVASEVGISSTKLKSNFKLFFGQTLYEYFNEKQMQFAKQKLQEETILIKEVALMVGYENVSKFSAAFKRYYGYLPSDVLK